MEKQQKRWKRQMKWIKEGARNFRLSLSLRVSLNYLRFFLINGIIFFGITGFLYLREEMKPSMEIAEQMTVLLEINEQKFVDFAVKENPKNLAVYWNDREQNMMIYSNGGRDWSNYRYWFRTFHLEPENGKWMLIIKDNQEIFRRGREYEVTFYYDISDLNSILRLM